MKTVERDKNTGKYTIEQLLDIMRLLRAPDGCPWDKEQTHESIRNNFLEEAYETVDAIDTNDMPALREELGDVLMQIVFHSIMAEEEGNFDFGDVVDEVSEKLVYRHPHVFSDTVADTTEKVLENWDMLKQTEKHQTTFTDTLTSVPKSFPALMKCAKVQKRAAKANVGIDEEVAVEAVKKSIENKDIGKLLFYAVALARTKGVDCEEALAKETDDFISRFSAAESSGEDLNNALKF